MSRLLGGGFDALRAELSGEAGGRTRGLLYLWLSLIYFKTHYKDLFLRDDLKLPLDNNRIGDRYIWEELHHVHCIARSAYTGAAIDSAALGLMLVLKAATSDRAVANFDFMDIHPGRTILLQTDDIALIAVMNDACLSAGYVQDVLQHVDGPFSPVQLHEVLAHVSIINMALPERPKFQSLLSEEGRYEIHAKVPEIEGKIRLNDAMKKVAGEVFKFVFESVSNVSVPGLSQEEAIERLWEGQVTFLSGSAESARRTAGSAGGGDT